MPHIHVVTKDVCMSRRIASVDNKYDARILGCEGLERLVASASISSSDQAIYPKLVAPVSPSGGQLTSSTTASPMHNTTVEGPLQPHLRLKLEAHRRWSASLPTGFLWSVQRIEISVTRADADHELAFVLEVFLGLPTSRLPVSQLHSNEEHAVRPAFKVERRFSEFEELRKSVSSCVSSERPCACRYCLAFVEYIRFSWTQPRGLVKLFGREEKRRQMLQTFINDFVTMGQRRVQKPKTSKRQCEAQQLVPQVLTAFLLRDAIF